MKRQLLIICTLALGCLLVLPALTAQEVDVQARGTDVEVDRGRVDVNVGSDRARLRSNSRMNQQIASWLLVDQHELIKLAEFGLERTKTPEVRELAEAIIRDHEILVGKLESIDAGDTNRNRARRVDAANDRADERRETNRELIRDARRDRDGVRRPLENLADRIEVGVERVADGAERVVEATRDAVEREVESDRARSGNSDGAPWISIHREIATKLTASARQDLERRHGYEFDAALVGLVVAAHLQQQASLEVLADRASGDFRQTLQQAEETIRQHRQKAEQVMEAIAPSGNRG